ncbi:hypothetical protein [Micromonospora sp. DT47]|uniref:hypothetical protein n=1 Tax=Micromonospora sp. DT47 TaxID=3393431 RepID=UPI003CF9B607
MAERSTARSADAAFQDHDDAASVVDSWIFRQSLLAAGGSDSYDRRQEAAAPHWHEEMPDEYEESYPPADTRQEHEARHAWHRVHPQYEDEYGQYVAAYPAHEHAYRTSDPLAYREPAYDEPDHTYLSDSYLSDEHDQAHREERWAQAPYDHATSVHADADTAQLERYTAPKAAYAHGEYPDRDEYHHEESDAQDAGTDEGRPRRTHLRDGVARSRPASRRRRWLIPVGGLAVGALLCALALTWGSGRPPAGGLPISAATTPPDAFQQPTTLSQTPSTAPSSATPRRSSATPSATPSVTPSATPSVTPSATPTPTSTAATPTPTRNSGPILLGPSSSRGVATMVQGYCDRHTGGSADPRNDGRWQCTRLLSASLVDMDVACRDTYDSGAYARTSNPGDAYAWRCYR